MARIIAFFNQKGGTAKTTSTLNVAAALAERGQRILAIDLDPQASLTMAFGVDVAGIEQSVYDLLVDEDVMLNDVIVPTQTGGVQLVPSHPDLAAAELELLNVLERERQLQRKLPGRGYEAVDFILIDSPPALGLLTINGLVAADWALVSSEAQYFALQGVEGALEAVEQVREYYNDDLHLLGVLLNIADMRTTHSRDAYAQLQGTFGDTVFETVIRSSIAYAESAERAIPILDYRPDRGSDYLSLAGELLRRLSRPDLLARLDELSTELVPAGAR